MGQQPESQPQAESDVKQLKNLSHLAEEKLNLPNEKGDKGRTNNLINYYCFFDEDFQGKFIIKKFLTTFITQTIK